MKEKMMPHIIAAGALVVFIVLGLACASMLPSIEKGRKICLTRKKTGLKLIKEWQIKMFQLRNRVFSFAMAE